MVQPDHRGQPVLMVQTVLRDRNDRWVQHDHKDRQVHQGRLGETEGCIIFVMLLLPRVLLIRERGDTVVHLDTRLTGLQPTVLQVISIFASNTPNYELYTCASCTLTLYFYEKYEKTFPSPFLPYHSPCCAHCPLILYGEKKSSCIRGAQ